MWALESDPALRATIVVVGVLDVTPDRDRLLRQVDAATRRVPRLRQRVARGPVAIAPPRWELDAEFDLDYHVRVVAAPRHAGPSGRERDHRPSGRESDRGLFELAQPLLTEGFDRSRPLWQLTVVEDGAGGRAGLIVKLHHALTDGVGAVRLAGALFDLERDPPEAAMPPPPDEPATTELGRLWDDLDHDMRSSVRLARRALPWALHALGDAIAVPDERSTDALETLRSLRRVGALGVKPLSPLMTGRSRRTHLEVVTAAVDELAAAGRSAGATVNDAFLAAVAGGLRRYHDKHGVHPAALRIGVPIDLRRPEDPDVIGNVFAPVRLVVPLHLSDPSERLAAVHDLVAAARREPALDLVDAAAAAVSHVPGATSGALAAATMRATDAVASNVPGSPVPLYVAGARLDRLVAFGPRSGAGLNLTLLSYAGTAEVAVNMDPAATPDTDTLRSCLRAGFDEVLELG